MLTDYNTFSTKNVKDFAIEVKNWITGSGDDVLLRDEELDAEWREFTVKTSNGKLDTKFTNSLLTGLKRNPYLIFKPVGLPLRLFLFYKFGLNVLTFDEVRHVTRVMGTVYLPEDETRSSLSGTEVDIKNCDMDYENVVLDTGAQTPGVGLTDVKFDRFDPGSKPPATGYPEEEGIQALNIPLPAEELNELFKSVNQPFSDEFITEVYEKIKYKGFNPAFFVKHCLIDRDMSPHDFRIFAFIGALTNNYKKVDKTALRELKVEFSINDFASNKQEMYDRKMDIETALTLSRFTSCVPGFVAFSLAQTKAWVGFYPEMPCLPCFQFFGAVSLPFKPEFRRAHKEFALKHSNRVSFKSKQEFNDQLYEQLASMPVPKKHLVTEVIEFLEPYCSFE